MNRNIQTGDVMLSQNSYGTIFVTRADGTPRGNLLGYSSTFQRKRHFYRRQDKTSMPCPLFTARNLNKPTTASALLGQLFPELDGATVWGFYWTGDKPLCQIITGLDAKAERKKLVLECLPPEQQTIRAGTVLVCSWGYDQTNIDYYLVLERRGSVAVLQEIAARTLKETGWMQGTCEPDPTQRKGEPFRRRVMVREGKETGCRIESFSWASVWSGQPDHWTAYA